MFRALLWGAAAGAVIAAPSLWRAHADTTDDDLMFLSGSTQALVMGPSGFPTPDAGYLAAADRIYLDPLGFNGTTLALTTPETGDYGASVAQGEQDLINTVTADYTAGDFSTTDPLTIMGYSQSSVVASLAEQQLADNGIPSDALRFVLIGDTASAQGGFLNTFGDTTFGQEVLTWLGDQNLIDATTPNDLYPTDVYTLTGDGWADWNNGANLFGMFTTHLEYFGLTPDEIAAATVTVDGLTDYYTIADPADTLAALVAAAETVGGL